MTLKVAKSNELRLDRGPIDHHRNRAVDLHFVHRPSRQIKRRAWPVISPPLDKSKPPMPGAAITSVIPFARVTANMCACRIHGGGGHKLRVEIAELADVHRRANRTDFVEPDLSDGIEHAPDKLPGRSRRSLAHPAGIATFAPTAAIFPSRIITVPFSIGGPANVKYFCAFDRVDGGGALWCKRERMPRTPRGIASARC